MDRDNRPECRVLQVFSTLGVGGAEVWLLALLRYFRAVQDDLPVRLRMDVLLTGRAGHFDDEARALGANLFYVPYSRRNLLRFVLTFRRLLARERYHAMHDHQDYVGGVRCLLGLGHLPPVRVIHLHNPPMNIGFFASSLIRRSVLSAGKYLVGVLGTQVLGTSRQLITEYGFDSRVFSGLPRRAAHCGFDVSRFGGDHGTSRREVREEFGWTGATKIILFVGRLDSNLNQKNPGFALEVAGRCALSDPTVCALFVGGGDAARERLEAEAKELKVGNRIRFVGVRSDVPRLMMAADVLLFPSVAEGLGMVAVEAQAAGLRVVASDTTPRECVVIPNGVEFLALSEGRDTWAEVVLRTVYMPEPDRRQWNASVQGSEFSIERSAATLLDIYRAERLVENVSEQAEEGRGSRTTSVTQAGEGFRLRRRESKHGIEKVESAKGTSVRAERVRGSE